MYKREKLFLLTINGPSGAGKTSLADLLHDELAYTAHVGTDHIKRYISEFREIPSHNKVSRKVTNAMVDEYLKNGINVIVEQGMSNEEVEVLKKISNKWNADFFVYRIEAPRDILEKRTDERSKKLNKPLFSKEDLDRKIDRYQKNTYPSNATFDSEKMSTKEISDHILKDLKE